MVRDSSCHYFSTPPQRALALCPHLGSRVGKPTPLCRDVVTFVVGSNHSARACATRSYFRPVVNLSLDWTEVSGPRGPHRKDMSSPTTARRRLWVAFTKQLIKQLPSSSCRNPFASHAHLPETFSPPPTAQHCCRHHSSGSHAGGDILAILFVITDKTM